jgi:hypothetical protein
MQQIYLYVVRHDQRFADWDYWNLGADGFWYGGHTTGGRLIGGSKTMDIANGETKGDGRIKTKGMKVRAMVSTEGMAGAEGMAAVGVEVEGMAGEDRI